MSLEVFSARLKELMQEEKTSARKLAKTLNLQRKSVFLWLNGKYYPKYDALIKLADYFEVNVSYLLGITDKIAFVQKTGEKPSSQEIFRARLTGYMTEKGVTAYKMSKRLGIGQTVFKRWLIKGAMPETANLIKLALVMDESVEYLLGLE